ncbi:hypothetical protein PROFUN_02051 [Planoprotostelium fungivorum]|uniref:Uncharacterized protein n=1 Tax=Planoprotostelium fungivorum TaxID=1890364 RepID=A0A2P6NB96_9EUKA|nr:hypothetical protein PROFUN_02051 [Planoprotostelium fungivorum]
MSEGPTYEDFAWAVKTGDLDRVKEFVEKHKFGLGPDPSSSNKRTPLHWAADFNQTAIISYLLSKGADINAKDQYGITPLLAAVYEDHFDAAKTLVEKKADVSAKGPDGQTAKQRAEKDSIKALFK